VNAVTLRERVLEIDDVGVRIADFNSTRICLFVRNLYAGRIHLRFESIPVVTAFDDSDYLPPASESHGGETYYHQSERILVDYDHPWAGEIFARCPSGETGNLLVREISV